jgi:hypothetical protein
MQIPVPLKKKEKEKNYVIQEQWHTLPVLRRVRQEVHEFEANLFYIERSYLNNQPASQPANQPNKQMLLHSLPSFCTNIK